MGGLGGDSGEDTEMRCRCEDVETWDVGVGGVDKGFIGQLIR